MDNLNQQPPVTSYNNPSDFLRDYYKFRKNQDPDFSYDVWAQELGYKNRSYLRFVVIGSRPLNLEIANLVSKSLKLSPEDNDYLLLMARLAQCKSEGTRKALVRQLLGLAELGNNRAEIQDHCEFLLDHDVPKILTLLTFTDFPRHADQLAQLLEISRRKVEDKLLVLEKLGLVVQEPDPSGMPQWRPLKKYWKVPANFKSPGHSEFYRESLNQAKQAINLAFEERRFRSLFLAFKPEEFQDFLQDFENFVTEQMARRGTDELNERRLYELNFNFFPSSQTLKGSPGQN